MIVIQQLIHKRRGKRMNPSPQAQNELLMALPVSG